MNTDVYLAAKQTSHLLTDGDNISLSQQVCGTGQVHYWLQLTPVMSPMYPPQRVVVEFCDLGLVGTLDSYLIIVSTMLMTYQTNISLSTVFVFHCISSDI